MAKRYAAIMPQACAVWAEEEGYEVDCRTYYGNGRLETYIPRGCEILFIVTTSRTSGMAERAANIAKERSKEKGDALAIIACGPHAVGSPKDCAWADLVLGETDRETFLLACKLRACESLPCFSFYGRGSFSVHEIPSVERREKFIRQSFDRVGLRSMQVVPLLGSVGCPNSCDFCIEAGKNYQARYEEEVRADLDDCARLFPGAKVSWHDANWGVSGEVCKRFMRPENPHVLELELRQLDERRTKDLVSRRVEFVAVGVESFHKYGFKVGNPEVVGCEKVQEVARKLNILAKKIPYVQANFMVGFPGMVPRDWDDLACAIVQTPKVWWNVSPVYPFAGTKIAREWKRSGLLIEGMPPYFQCSPLLTHRLEHMSQREFYEELRDIYRLQLRQSKRVNGMQGWYLRLRALFAKEALATIEVVLGSSLEQYYVEGDCLALRDLWGPRNG